MKRTQIPIQLIFFLIALFGFSACNTDQIDRALETDEAAGSISQTQGEPGSDASPEISVERIAKPKWKLLKSVKGKKSQKSPAFKVGSEEWKIRWEVKSRDNDDSEFIIIMHNKNDKQDSEIVAQQMGSGKDFADFTGGIGDEYYLDISSKQPYEVWIEEYK